MPRRGPTPTQPCGAAGRVGLRNLDAGPAIFVVSRLRAPRRAPPRPSVSLRGALPQRFGAPPPMFATARSSLSSRCARRCLASGGRSWGLGGGEAQPLAQRANELCAPLPDVELPPRNPWERNSPHREKSVSMAGDQRTAFRASSTDLAA